MIDLSKFLCETTPYCVKICGLKTGIYIPYPNLPLYSVQNYHNDKQHGEQKEYNYRKQLYKVTNYVRGVKHGLEKRWFMNGLPKVLYYNNEMRNGLEIKVYSYDELIKQKSYSYDLLNYLYKEVFSNGKLKYVFRYLNGKVTYKEKWSDGKLIYIMPRL